MIADVDGNVYVYDIDSNTWREIGIITQPPGVTESQNGTIDPTLFGRLHHIQSLIKSGIEFDKTKIFLGANHTDNPYFYYFTSTDDLLRFTPEVLMSGVKRLRIELNRARLLQLLLRTPCIGPPGQRGAKGISGLPGVPAPDEKFQQPKILADSSGILNTLTFSTFVNTPLNEPISIRIFEADKIVLEILVGINGTDPVAINNTDQFVADPNKTMVSFDGKLVSGTIVLSKGQFSLLPNLWRFKARQRGPQGFSGLPGDAFLQVVPELLADPLIVSSTAVIQMRQVLDKNIAYTAAPISPLVRAMNLKMTSDSFPVPTDFNRLGVMAVDYSLLSAKDIAFYHFNENAIPVPDIKIPAWTPLMQCRDRRRFAMSNFKWFDQIDLASKDFGCVGVEVPFNILTDPQPGLMCCREDFFLCPNLGDKCNILSPSFPAIVNPPPTQPPETSSSSSSSSIAPTPIPPPPPPDTFPPFSNPTAPSSSSSSSKSSSSVSSSSQSSSSQSSSSQSSSSQSSSSQSSSSKSSSSGSGSGSGSGSSSSKSSSNTATTSSSSSCTPGPCTDPAGGVLTGCYDNPCTLDLADGVVDLRNLTGSAMTALNLLSNPGFNYAQLYDPTALTSIVSGKVGADAWRADTESGANYAYQRVSNQVFNFGFKSANRGHYEPTPFATTSRVVVYQALSHLLTRSLKGHDLNFCISINTDAGFSSTFPFENFSAMLLQWNGPVDDLSSGLGPSWAGSGVSPTFANATVLADSGPTEIPSFNVKQLNVSLLNLPDINNLVVAIATDDPAKNFEAFELGEAGLYVGAWPRTVWNPLSPAEDESRVEQFIEKSYDGDIKPTTVTNIGAEEFIARNTNPLKNVIRKLNYRRTKIKIPNLITLYSPNSGAAGNWYDVTSGPTDVAATPHDIGTRFANVSIPGVSVTDKDKIRGHFVIDASL